MAGRSYWWRLVSGEARGPIAALARAGLWVASLFYAAVVRLRNTLYDWGVFKTHRLPVPVISVGNLTVGGTGKTPFVELVCRKLLEMGRKPAILTRGYKAGVHGSDEAQLLAEHLPTVPVVVNSDRVAGGREAIDKHGADVLVMDDGFQHRRLHRDLDIVLVDAVNPFGFGHVLPRGLLREPVSGLHRSHLIVRTRLPHGQGAEKLGPPGPPFPDRPVLLARHAVTDYLFFETDPPAGVARSPETLRGRDLFAFSGLGDPAAFTQSLRDWGCRVVGERHFPDHHEFTTDDLTELARLRPISAVFATTEKDHRRLAWLPAEVRKSAMPLAVVRIRMEFVAGERALDAALAEACGPDLRSQ